MILEELRRTNGVEIKSVLYDNEMPSKTTAELIRDKKVQEIMEEINRINFPKI